LKIRWDDFLAPEFFEETDDEDDEEEAKNPPNSRRSLSPFVITSPMSQGHTSSPEVEKTVTPIHANNHHSVSPLSSSLQVWPMDSSPSRTDFTGTEESKDAFEDHNSVESLVKDGDKVCTDNTANERHAISRPCNWGVIDHSEVGVVMDESVGSSIKTATNGKKKEKRKDQRRDRVVPSERNVAVSFKFSLHICFPLRESC